ncbi:MAG: FecCD family ABC transporter permease [Syntrophobacteraceae bacterium]
MRASAKKQGDAAQRLPASVVSTVLAIALAATAVWAAGSGYVKIPFWEVVRIVAAKLTGNSELIARLGHIAPTVVMEVRLPRILASILVGANLAVSGAVFQGILLNPLAEPYTLGISAGAAFGASLALLLNLTFLGLWSTPAFAFAGAVLTLLAVIYLTAGSGELSSGNLILSGIIVAAILSAAVSLIKYLADDSVGIIIFWLMGSFASRTWAEVGLLAVTTVVGLSVFFYFGRDLNLLALGDRTAGSLGISPRKISLFLLTMASLTAAVCVAVSGIIGFVGLLVPHMVRFVTGPDNRRLLPVCALFGGLLLLCADTVTRTLLPREVPIGVITALIGGPFFCYIYRRRQLRENRRAK